MYELYYFIPFPQSQKIQEMTEYKSFWSFADCDSEAGVFVDKVWFDDLKKRGLLYGL